jgi:hypothetical protein
MSFMIAFSFEIGCGKNATTKLINTEVSRHLANIFASSLSLGTFLNLVKPIYMESIWKIANKAVQK